MCCSSLVLGSFFMPYSQGLKRSLREAEQIIEKCPHDFSKRSRNTLSVTLSRLKRKGMVTSYGSRKKMIWSSTKEGKRYIKTFIKTALLPTDGNIRLITFDIPEADKGKRNWLRMQLVACGYSFLQKSVWIGTRPLSREFLAEVKKRDLAPYIHMIDIYRQGTLARML